MINVQLIDPVEGGHLYPRYVEDAHLLAVEATAPPVPWPLGITVGGSVVFDLDEERILVNFDVHWHRDNWIGLSAWVRPKAACRARLRFTEETLRRGDFHGAVVVTTNPDRTEVRVQLDRPAGAGEWVELSDRCLAWLEGDRLLGFYLKL
jgi:hypothetical protein